MDPNENLQPQPQPRRPRPQAPKPSVNPAGAGNNLSNNLAGNEPRIQMPPKNTPPKAPSAPGLPAERPAGRPMAAQRPVGAQGGATVQRPVPSDRRPVQTPRPAQPARVIGAASMGRPQPPAGAMAPKSVQQAAKAQQQRPLKSGATMQGAAQGQQGPARSQNGQQPSERTVSGAMSRERRRLVQQQPSHTDLVPSLDTMPVNKSEFNGFAGAQQSKKGPAGQQRRVNYTERVPTVRVMPLGGLGEIGKNMMAVECGQDIVILDMGFAFPDKNQPGVDYIIPDTTYLEKNKHKVRAIIITHGHMDHIGAAGYIIPKFPVPIYGSRLSLGMVAKQIEEFKIQTPKFVVLDPDKGERVQLGQSFNLELVRVNHTISDSTAAVLRTPAGILIDTGDWRLDPTPLNGQVTNMDRFRQLGDEGVLLLMSDSTSCDQAGRGGTEQSIVPVIDDLFGRANGRIIISAFSSSITRMQLIVDATHKAGRKLALVGRSVLSNIELCVRMGYIKIPAGLVVKVQDITSLPDSQVVVLCTGSQGEENSALVRMSTGDHQNIKIKPGDTIILSSSVIPGNEVSVVTLIDNLMREGAVVYARSTAALKGHGPVHVGGHAYQEDTADMVQAVRPKYYMPIHGEFHHLVYNAEIAVQNGVPKENIFVMDNGDCLELTANSAQKVARIPAGVVMIDGAGVGDVEGVVLRDRIAMANDGVFMIVATVSRKTGKLISSPDIISRGFIYMKENEDLINRARAEVRRLFEKRAPQEDWTKFKLKLRDEIGDILYAKTKRNPMVLPVVNEV
ncbi:MAG TPA: RNase J family beta-CASP ribonuclease [Candidatus Saccharimonadia bacterium]